MTSEHAIRHRIKSRMLELGLNNAQVSRMIGKNPGYMHDYFEQKRTRIPPLEVRVNLAHVLKIEPAELAAGPEAVAAHRTASPGFAENAEPYSPPQNHYLNQSPHIAYFRMKDAALDQMPRRIVAGDILAFDINQVSPAKLEMGKVVVAQLADRAELTRSHGTLIGMWVPPNKIVSNSSGPNWIVSLDDETLPYEPILRGVLIGVVSEG